MYPITRESVIVVISSSVAENAVCWCDGRKKRNRRILRRLTHLAWRWRVIGELESGMAIGFRETQALRGRGRPRHTSRVAQARPPSKYLKYVDLTVDLRFTCAALPS